MSTSNRARWVFDCGNWFPSENDWSIASRSIQPEEKERIGRFVFKQDAKRSIIGQLMIRKFLSEATHLPWSKIKTKRDQNNKPIMEGFNFNISHDGNLVVLAGEKETIVGIDIMRNCYNGGKSLNEFFRLMHRNFHINEWRYINKGTDTEKTNSFYRFWCLKESYVKATGTGLTIDLKKICFIPKSELMKDVILSDTELFIDGKLMADWKFHEYLFDNHTITVCVKGPITPIKFKFINFQDLISNAEMILEEDKNYCKLFLSKEEKP
jgi:4'-phosphopantetheinyl transferase